jgi:hypothetical protein
MTEKIEDDGLVSDLRLLLQETDEKVERLVLGLRVLSEIDASGLDEKDLRSIRRAALHFVRQAVVEASPQRRLERQMDLAEELDTEVLEAVLKRRTEVGRR